MEPKTCTYTAFVGTDVLATGTLADVARRVKEAVDRDPDALLLVFDDLTGRQVEVDLRGSVEDVLGRLEQPATPETRRGPGRPKLGVVAREVTLLPRHWEWLGRQPGGASVTLRKLVEQARRERAGEERVREAQEAAYRFTTALAGDLPGYEEAMRALFGKDGARFAELTGAWPSGVRDHARRLAADAFGEAG